MNIGVLTATLGVDAQSAINSMTHFERVMITLVNKIDSTLERMEASMAGVTGAALDMRNKSVAGFTATANAAKVATVATQQYTTAVVAANAATKVSPVSVKTGGKAISVGEIANAVNQRTSISSIARSANATSGDINNAIAQRLAIEKQTAAFNKMHNQAIVTDNKRTAIAQANAAKITAAFNKMHEKAIAEDNKRTAIAQANAAKITAANKFSLDSVTSSLNNVSQKFRTFGYLTSATVTLPMVMAGKSAFNMAKDYEFSIQKIVGLTGVAQSEVNKWSDQILKMGPQVAKGPKELAEAMYFISSSGIKGAEALNVLNLSAKAATSGLGETQQVADLLTSALNAYRGTGLTASYATDVLVAAVREGKAEASGFSSAMGQIIPIASQLGVSFDQVAGGMAAITLTGSSSSQAAVYLKGVFNSLLTASTQGEKALNHVGTSYAQLRNILANQGLIPLIQKLRDIQIKYGDELLSNVLPNIRALTGYLSLAGKNFQYNTELMKRVTNATGSLGQAFAAVADTIKVRYDTAISQAQVSLISLGKSVAEAFLPLLENLIKKLGEVTEWFNGLSEAEKRNKLEWVAFIAILGPASLALSVLGYALSGLITIGKGLVNVFNILRITMLSNPYLLVGAGVIAITGGIVHFIRKTNEASEAQNGFNNALIKVNDSIKKLKDLTSVDYESMNFMQLSGVKDEAIKQKAQAFKLISEAVERSGHTMDQFYAGERMGKYTKYIGTQVDAWTSANNMIKEVDKSLNVLADSFGNTAKSTKIAITNIGNLREESIKLHKLVLEQYDAELKKEKEEIKYKNMMIKLNKDLRDHETHYSSFPSRFLVFPANVASGPTKLENEYAKGLVSYKDYLDTKYKMDLVAAGQSADARMQVETEYIKNLKAYKASETQSYLQSTSDAISAISNLIEANKQRELSAVGDNAAAREKIEKEYMQKQKAWAIAQAIINGALAVTNMIANVPLSVLNPSTWVGIGVAAASTAAQVAIIAGQKMEKGGIIPAGYPNDTYPAMLSSGETVLPKALSGAAMQNQMSGEVVFTIAGTTLVGVLKNQGRKSNSFR